MTLRYARIFLSEAWVHSAGTHADPLFFFGISGDGCTSREKLPAVRTYDFFFFTDCTPDTASHIPLWPKYNTWYTLQLNIHVQYIYEVCISDLSGMFSTSVS